MSDQERNRQREHWQAIAEQLGLAPESEASKAEAPKSTAAQETSPGRGAPAPSAQSEPSNTAAQERPARNRCGEAPPERENVAAARPAAAEPAPFHARHEGKPPEQPGPAEPPPPRKRGGGRRPRREEAVVQGKGETPPEREPRADEETQERGARSARRGRGRGRGKKDKPEEAGAKSADRPTAPRPQSAEAGVEPEEADEDLRSLTNWNAPSWNELIASLYRPER